MPQLARMLLAVVAGLVLTLSFGCGGQTVERPTEKKPMMDAPPNSSESPEPPPLPPDD